jgi:6-phosphogluconolactonase (cycloisomerase 2 family)
MISKVLLSVALAAASCNMSAAVQLKLFVGTYTDKGSCGIYSYQFDQTNGRSSVLDSARVNNPSFLTFSADGRHLYSVSEYAKENSFVYAFAINKSTGKMHYMNRAAAKGSDPCNIVTDGHHVYTANYSSGDISIFSLQKDGSVGTLSRFLHFDNGSKVDASRQSMSHLHCVAFSPDGKYAYGVDLGGDCVYKFNARPTFTAGKPDRFRLTPGCGPRHLTFSPNGRMAYLMTEISGEVFAFKYNKVNGNLTQVQVVRADTVGGEGGADIHVSPDGKFLYASLRLKADGVAIYRIGADGKLTKVGYQLTGIHPRNFAITPNGKYMLVACRDSNCIQVYERNAVTGLLQDIHQDIRLSKPVCVKLL